MAIILNKKGSKAVFHFTANGTANLVGNSTTSDIALDDEIITAAAITQIWYGSANSGYWTVSRGSNVVSVLTGSDHVGYSDHGVSLIKDKTGSLAVTLTNATVGYVMIEVSKQGNKGSQG